MESRKTLWEGDSGREAAAALQTLHAAPPVPERLPRHDDATDAAASKARAIGKAKRAEEAALWLGRLMDPMSHEALCLTLEKAGLDGGRAEREIQRMLACDILTEPRAGYYRMLSGALELSAP